MIYEFSFKTGSSFSDSYSPNEDTCIKSSYFGGISLSSSLVTGINLTKLSINGQTLVEQTAQAYDAGFSTLYQNSGDYYFNSGENFRNVNFASNFEPLLGSEVEAFYTIKDQQIQTPMGTGSSASQISSTLMSQISSRFPLRTGSWSGMNSFDYFLNGQKMYSGVSGSFMLSGGEFSICLLRQYLWKSFRYS
jgi:hypothetical protein